MANANARFQAVKQNAINDETNLLNLQIYNVAIATNTDLPPYSTTYSSQPEADAVLAIAQARVTAKTDLIAALNLL
jgi:hypothetical protein